MRFAYMLFCNSPAAGDKPKLSDDNKATITAIAAATPGLSKACLYTPETATDLFNHDGASPPFGLQMYFEELASLEAALGPGGYLQRLADPKTLSSLAGLELSQQAMYVRHFPVDDERLQPEGGNLPCSYVVHYPGPAQDMNAWLSHYVTHHPPIMRKFPHIRAIEVLSRIDWCGDLPFRRVNHMQRNRVMFDSAAALTRALQSPARLEMRADFGAFPPYDGGSEHYPMATQIILPTSST